MGTSHGVDETAKTRIGQLQSLLGKRVRVTLHTGSSVTVSGILVDFTEWGEVLLDDDGDQDYWPCLGVEEDR